MHIDAPAPVPDTHALQHDAEWSELIERLAQRKVQLIQDFKARFQAWNVYDGKVPEEDIDALIESTMNMYLVMLAGKDLDAELQRLPADLGRRRAQQGVPAELLMEGVRTNSRVIWNALREISADTSAAALVRNTDTLLSLVEWHLQEVQSSYLRERELLARRSARRRDRAMAILFAEPVPDLGALILIAADLGLPITGSLDVVAQLGNHPEDCVLCAAGAWLVHELPEGTCHLRLRGDNLREVLSGKHAAIASAPELALVPDAVRAAFAVVRALLTHAPQPAIVAESWPAVAFKVLVATLPESQLPAELNRLRRLRVEERRRLVRTTRTYLRTGSIKQTAETLYCHRNTIVKRLERFRELTGLDTSVPTEAALAVLILTALAED